MKSLLSRAGSSPAPSPSSILSAASEDDEDDFNPLAAIATGAAAFAAASAGASLPFAPAAVPEARADEILRSYTQFLDKVEADQIESVLFSADGKSLTAIDVNGDRFQLGGIPSDPDMLKTLRDHKVEFSIRPQPVVNTNAFGAFIANILPWLFIGGLGLLATRGMGGAGGPPGMGQFGKSGAKFEMSPKTGVTFEKVAGQDEAKQELKEVVTFLKNPGQFTKLGAKIPRGVIMEGPPGTGKTLMARAVAGEAGVPFFSTSGSSFVEVFVGVGASRVRDLFKEAKKVAPCIIFIDEIDSIGRSRASGGFASPNDEREQTLNQILAEMDGFTGNSGVVVIAATNRIDILDSALLRPGRFDRKVSINLPDLKARREILDVYIKGKPLSPDVDLDMTARRTTGFSGADLENLMNEAAIFAARKGKDSIDQEDIDGAFDRILIGSEKKNAIQSEKIKQLVAFHEAGHAITGALSPGYDPIQKISIIPRTGGAGGVTFFLPTEERLNSGLYTVDYLKNQLVVSLGGRAAEEVVYGSDQVTTGASNDLQQVTRIARSMVVQFGMNEIVGQLNLEDSAMRRGDGPFLETSQATREGVDEEVRKLVDWAYDKSKRVLLDNRGLLDEVAKRLVEEEVLTGEEFIRMVAEYKRLSDTKPQPVAVAA